MANARYVALAAAVVMAVAEIVFAFYESFAAFVLAALLLIGAAWFWFRESAWSAIVLAIVFLLEIVYLSDYDWTVTRDRVNIIVTLVLCSVGLLALLVYLVQRRRDTPAPRG